MVHNMKLADSLGCTQAHLEEGPLGGVLHVLRAEPWVGDPPVGHPLPGGGLRHEVLDHTPGDDVAYVVGAGAHVLAERNARDLACVQVGERRASAVPRVDGRVDLRSVID